MKKLISILWLTFCGCGVIYTIAEGILANPLAVARISAALQATLSFINSL